MDTWITPDELYEAIVFFFCCFFFSFLSKPPLTLVSKKIHLTFHHHGDVDNN